MADRVFHHDVVGAGAVLEKHLHGVGNRALVGLKVFAGEARLFDDEHFLAQHINDRMSFVKIVLVLLGDQVAEGQRHGGHVLNAVIAVGSVGQRPDLGNDADRRFVGGDDDSLDFVQSIAHLRMQRHRCLARSLRVEFGGKADLEQDVFHHITAEWP